MKKEQWLECLEKLETEVSPQKFRPWIKPLQYLGFDKDNNLLKLGLASTLKLNMVRENFLSIIEQTVSQYTGKEVRISLQVGSPSTAMASGIQTASHNSVPAPPNPAGAVLQQTQTQIPDAEPRPASTPTLPGIATSANGSVRLIKEFTFENLVDGKSNQMAISAAMQVVDQPGVAYNPLFLYGGVGLGKTHLLNAIGNAYLQRNPGAKIAYLHAQTYFDEMVLAIQRRTPHDFKRKYQSLDLMLIDDIQFLGNRDRTQEEFFYTFEALLSARKQMVITGDTYPRHLSAFQERLISRFGSGLIVEIEPPELELRVAILLRKGEQLKRERPDFPHLPDDVALFIAKNVRSNVRELEGALIRTLAFASFRKLELTVDVAREASRDLLKQNQRPISIEQIQKTVADQFKIRIADMYSKRRPANIARARQVAMYLAKEMTLKSYPEIGEAFGGRDHTTVMHAVKRITDLRQKDADLNHQIHLLEQSLRP
ncbi:MAG: chromosomal replication initiator protein DnaA [Burkholderiaceae bacterium]